MKNKNQKSCPMSCVKGFLSSSWGKIFIIFAAISFLLRVGFFVWQRADIEISGLNIAKAFGFGLFYDIITLSYIALIPIAYYTFTPAKIFNSSKQQKVNRVLYFLFLVVIIFSAVSEVVFWDEFQTRFNFIAVDYLIYTTEVIENIVESYPIIPIFAAIFSLAGAIFYLTKNQIFSARAAEFKTRFKKFAILSTFCAASFFLVDNSKIAHFFLNKYVSEISQNGIYQLFSAYRNNEIDYDSLYLTKDEKAVINTLRSSLKMQEPKVNFLNEDDISRLIPAPRSGGEKRYNVIFVTMESFSADFMASFGNEENITPNLDKFAKEGLFFTKLKATGTRTVRGLEALSLSIPPTPGNSIVRRPNNENMFNIASPLKERGYEAKFIYGGDGYFDNMNYFFGNNGFDVVDRKNFTSEEITFSNAWGVADEDLFAKAVKEADKSFSNGKPFFNFIMTTSNHRPFTYPNGKIDIDSKTGRNGAVKYADYSIGRLVEMAKSRPWFDNTIFVFIADHCAGSAGNTDVPLWRYQIPAIFYAPKIIKPQIFSENSSQIDIAPTLLGIMNLSYKSKFFGIDVLTNHQTHNRHAFVSTYTDIGYFRHNNGRDMLYLLKPKKEVKFYNVEIKKYGWEGSKETLTSEYDEEELNEAISYYEGAAHLFKNGKLKNFDQK
jgi:phosphoglycerol transferase MdoB-like AlkP superfamily enzyme